MTGTTTVPPPVLPDLPPTARSMLLGPASRGRHMHLAAHLPPSASVPGGEVRAHLERVAALYERRTRTVARMRALVDERRTVWGADVAAHDAALLEDRPKLPTPKLPEHDRRVELEASQAAALTRAVDSAVDALLGETIPEHGPATAEVIERRAAELVAKAEAAQATADAARAEARDALQLAGFVRRGVFSAVAHDPAVALQAGAPLETPLRVGG